MDKAKATRENVYKGIIEFGQRVTVFIVRGEHQRHSGSSSTQWDVPPRVAP